FKPLFQFPISQILKALSTGSGDTLDQTLNPIISSATAIELNQPEINILSQVSRAIHLKRYTTITYHSLSSGETQRKIAPFAIINSGLRWHVRAYDQKSEEFRDFVFTRILSAKESGEGIKQEHSSINDDKWNEKITLELVPHPDNIKEKRAIELDYKMIDSKKEIKVRKAIAGYILRHWNVDCTEDHRLDGKHFQLWLKNKNSIDGIDEIILAPGIDDS
ncbi:MAG: WYL domain-containing protein, partial [Bacteroidetes bacterium]|nr:WYL domain-containing protein [Bacteroidota bacterium]